VVAESFFGQCCELDNKRRLDESKLLGCNIEIPWGKKK
jgi:hypothetical protein